MRATSRHDDCTADRLRPSCEQSLDTSTRSWHHWQKLLQSAACIKEIPVSCFSIQVLLNQTPSIPNHPKIKEDVGNNLCLEGNSEWDIGQRRGCSLECTTKSSRLQKVPIGSPKPNFCQLSKAMSPIWPSGHHNIGTAINYLAMFVLGWSYILSARLVETCRKSSADHILYTNSRATVHPKAKEANGNTAFSIEVGNLTAVELRWWTAVLAPGCGWQAVLFRPDRHYYPPWSCHLSQDQHFEIIHPTRVMDVDYCPPTSVEAQEYLSAFAKLNNVYDQLQVALAACLTLPPQGRFGAPIELPHPRVRFPRCTKPISIRQSTDESHIPHYMALSCIPNSISSSMFGCFWEPGVECHLASEWLHPVQKLIQSIREEDRPHTIVKMMALHRPSSAPLWLGAAITGLLPTLVSVVSEHLPPISLEATVWTRSIQSFMDPRFHCQPPMHKDRKGRTCISRDDEFRLLYITDVESQRYPSPPLSPWPPFGTVDISTTSLDVQQHINCAHQLLYKQWKWQLEDRPALPDLGIATLIEDVLLKRGSLAGYLRLQIVRVWKYLSSLRRVAADNVRSGTTSRSATRSIFQWSLSDGVRIEDNEFWEHEWLKDLLEDESDDEELEEEVLSRST